MAHDLSKERRFLNIALLTVSDTRSLETDTSGSYLQQALEEEGHHLADRQLVIDDIYQMRATVSAWIADPQVDIILTTGGTGFTGRDSTPEALAPLFDKHIEGFGELFRQLSYDGNRHLYRSVALSGRPYPTEPPSSAFPVPPAPVKPAGTVLFASSSTIPLVPVILFSMLELKRK